jgi:hypothetical protein
MISITEELLKDIIFSLDWMVEDMDGKNKNDVSFIEDSLELKKAKKTLRNLESIQQERKYVQNG